MDHEVIPFSSIICDWPLNSSWDHYGFTSRKKIVRVIPTSLFLGLHSIHYHESNGYCSGREVKEVLSLQMSRDDGK
jgi:hypothetical protein